MSFGRETKTNKQENTQGTGMQAAQNAFRAGGMQAPKPTEPQYKLMLMVF
jgi:hypothetical protein